MSDTLAEQAAQRSGPARRTASEEAPLSQWQRCAVHFYLDIQYRITLSLFCVQCRVSFAPAASFTTHAATLCISRPHSYSAYVLNAYETARRLVKGQPDTHTLERLKGTWLDPVRQVQQGPSAPAGEVVSADIDLPPTQTLLGVQLDPEFEQWKR